jgi:hypothetical protein
MSRPPRAPAKIKTEQTAGRAAVQVKVPLWNGLLFQSGCLVARALKKELRRQSSANVAAFVRMQLFAAEF